jgi:Ca2+/Na+ antiporter
MKNWKLVSGILSIVLSVLVLFQSCAAGLSNTLSENGEIGGSAGLIVAILLLAGGITSIATRKGGKGGSIALIVLFAIAALVGFTCAGSYSDLLIWSGWCLICAVVALISILKKSPQSTAPSSSEASTETPAETPTESPDHSQN